MKLNIFFENAFVELGIFARQDFLSMFIKDGEEIDTVMPVTIDLQDKVKSMTAMDFGFTDKIKAFFVKQIELNIGKKLLLVDDFITSDTRRNYCYKVVALINTGINLTDAVKQAKSLETQEIM